MKRKTLMTLGIAGALACGTSSAATFLCTQDQAGGSSVSCAEIPSEVLGSMTSGPDVSTLSPPSVTYYLVPLEQDQVAMLERSEPSIESRAAFSSDRSSIDLSSADQWQHSEPRSMTYFSSTDAN